MALFEFTAKDNLGNSKSGTVEAKSQDDALLEKNMPPLGRR